MMQKDFMEEIVLAVEEYSNDHPDPTKEEAEYFSEKGLTKMEFKDRIDL